MGDFHKDARSESGTERPQADKNRRGCQKRGGHNLISQRLHRQDVALVSNDPFDPHVSCVIDNADGCRQGVLMNFYVKVQVIDEKNGGGRNHQNGFVQRDRVHMMLSGRNLVNYGGERRSLIAFILQQCSRVSIILKKNEPISIVNDVP